MKSEKRLIDANVLYEKATHAWDDTLCDECYSEIIDLIDEAPTVDAVEVVRCKDCKNGRQPWLEGQTMVKCMIGKSAIVTPDHFCSYGERRTDDA